MAEPLSCSGAAADPLRPARTFAPVFAVGAVAFLVVAVLAAGSATRAEPGVVAQAEGTAQETALVLPDGVGAPDLRLWGARTDGAPVPDDASCTLTTTGRARASDSISTSTLEVDGRRLRLVAEVSAGWAPGDTVRCTGVSRLAATSGSGPLVRLALAALCLAGAILSSVLWGVGRSSARARQRQGRRA